MFKAGGPVQSLPSMPGPLCILEEIPSFPLPSLGNLEGGNYNIFLKLFITCKVFKFLVLSTLCVKGKISIESNSPTFVSNDGSSSSIILSLCYEVISTLSATVVCWVLQGM